MMLYLRIVSFVLWIGVAIALLPSALRYIRGWAFTDVDEYRTAFFFTALLFIGSLGRWIFLPENDGLFSALYALTAALAVYILMLTRQSRGK